MSEKYRVNPFYNGVSTFKSAFPDLQDALIEWREMQGPEDELSGDIRKTGYKRGNFTQGVTPCSNPGCHEGGYQLDRLVADMLRLDEVEREGMMLCSGREVGGEVRRGPVRCPHRIVYKATLTHRTDDEPGGNEQGQRQRRRGRGRGPRRRNVA